MANEGDFAASCLRLIGRTSPYWANETTYAAAVATKVGRSLLSIEENELSVISSQIDNCFVGQPSLAAFLGARKRQINHMIEEEADIVISGEYGDAVFRNDETIPIHLSLTSPASLKEIFGWCKSEGIPLPSMCWRIIMRDLQRPRATATPSHWMVNRYPLSEKTGNGDNTRPPKGRDYTSRYLAHLDELRVLLAGRLQ